LEFLRDDAAVLNSKLQAASCCAIPGRRATTTSVILDPRTRCFEAHAFDLMPDDLDAARDATQRVTDVYKLRLVFLGSRRHRNDQVLRYAARVIDLMDQLGLDPPRNNFSRSVRGKSNRPKKELAPIYLPINPRLITMHLGEIDLHLFGEGRHEEIYKKLGAHVQSEAARRRRLRRLGAASFGVSVVGDFNNWDGREHQMQTLGNSGLLALFHPQTTLRQSVQVRNSHAPSASRFSKPILTRSTRSSADTILPSVYSSKYKFRDSKWIKSRAVANTFASRSRSTKLHFGSWRRNAEADNRPLTYREWPSARQTTSRRWASRT
jgi:hypothetical protein